MHVLESYIRCLSELTQSLSKQLATQAFPITSTSQSDEFCSTSGRVLTCNQCVNVHTSKFVGTFFMHTWL
jgi:hypothetical protein